MEPIASTAPSPSAPKQGSTFLRSITRNLQSYLLVGALVVIWLGFGLANPAYVSANNIVNTPSQMAIIAIMATAMVFVIVTGGIDLSVGYGSGFVSVVTAWLLYSGHADTWISKVMPGASQGVHNIVAAVLVIILGVLLGALMGFCQGFIISRLDVPPFIVTLGGFSIFKAGILLITDGNSLSINTAETLKYLAKGLLPPLVGYAIAALVTLAFFARVFTARARRRKHGGQPGLLWLQLLGAGFFSALVIGYVLLVNGTFEPKKPVEQAEVVNIGSDDEATPTLPAATDTAPAGEAKQDDAKAADAKTGDAKTGDAKPADAKTGDAKPADAKPADAKADEAKTEPAAKDEPKAADGQNTEEAAGGNHASEVGASTPDVPKIEEATEEEAAQESNEPDKGLPVLVVILGLVVVLMSWISQNTPFGRYTYAYGGNRESARLSGIDTKNVILKVYTLMGLMMGVAGVLLAGYVGSGIPSAGQGYELDVIASCILGGTSTLGGEGTIFGAVVGALIMQSLSTGLQLTKFVDPNMHYAVKGAVLILAVFADIQLKKKRG